MASFPKYCLSLVLLIAGGMMAMWSCDNLSNELYTHLDPNERRKLSSDYLALGKALGGGTPRSMRALEKATRIFPENELVWLELAYPYLYAGKYEEWNYHMNKAIELNPQTWQGLRGYQKLYFLRDYGGALYDLDATDTLTIDKTDYAGRQSVHYLRGLCYLGLKDYKLATDFLEKYLEDESSKTGTIDIDPMAYVYLGIIENEKQDYRSALEVLTKATAEKYSLADAHYHSAYAHFMLGNIDDASEQISIARERYEEKEYNKSQYLKYEVPHQLYLAQIDALDNDIKCFQD